MFSLFPCHFQGCLKSDLLQLPWLSWEKVRRFFTLTITLPTISYACELLWQWYLIKNCQEIQKSLANINAILLILNQGRQKRDICVYCKGVLAQKGKQRRLLLGLFASHLVDLCWTIHMSNCSGELNVLSTVGSVIA